MTTDESKQAAKPEPPPVLTQPHEHIVAEAFQRLIGATRADIAASREINFAQLRVDLNIALARLAGAENLLTALNPEFVAELNLRTANFANQIAEQIEMRLNQPRILGANGVVLKSN